MLKLFCKSWVNDFQWLKQAMISVQKTCQEPVEWGICVDDGTKDEFSHVLVQVMQESNKTLEAKVYEVSKVWPEAMRIQNGYLRQQWIKMNSHRVMGDDVFWIWDSDLIAMRPFSRADFCGFGDKPIYWYSQYNSIMENQYRSVFEGRMNMIREIFNVSDVPFEWMRCIPIAQHGGILKHASGTKYWDKAYQMLCNNDARFSEFNVIGHFYHQFFPDAFDWRNTVNYPGKTFSGGMGDKNFIVSQGYSWGGMPENVSNFVKSL